MNIESKKSGHWTDEQLIAHLYGVGPTAAGDGAEESHHLSGCELCRSRLEAMKARHAALVADSGDWQDVSPAFLAEQRRRIYDRLSSSQSWWQVHSLWRWASAGTAAAALGAGLVIFTGVHPGAHPECKVSDAELAQEVSAIAGNTEALPAAPLKVLFE